MSAHRPLTLGSSFDSDSAPSSTADLAASILSGSADSSASAAASQERRRKRARRQLAEDREALVARVRTIGSWIGATLAGAALWWFVFA